MGIKNTINDVKAVGNEVITTSKINGRNFYDKFLKSCNDTLENNNNIRLEINNDDMLMEKGFFAFLNDLLKDLPSNRELELNNLLKTNEMLGKKALIDEIDKHLKELKDLTKKDLENRGINEYDLNKIEKNLGNNKFCEFLDNLLENKELNSVKDLVNINLKDIHTAFTNKTGNKLQDTATNVMKKVVKV